MDYGVYSLNSKMFINWFHYSLDNHKTKTELIYSFQTVKNSYFVGDKGICKI